MGFEGRSATLWITPRRPGKNTVSRAPDAVEASAPACDPLHAHRSPGWRQINFAITTGPRLYPTSPKCTRSPGIQNPPQVLQTEPTTRSLPTPTTMSNAAAKLWRDRPGGATGKR